MAENINSIVKTSEQFYYAGADMMFARNYKSYLDKDGKEETQDFLLAMLSLRTAPVLYARSIDTKNPESVAYALQDMADFFGGLPYTIRFGGLIPKAVDPVIQSFVSCNDISLVKVKLSPGAFPAWFLTKETFDCQSALHRDARLSEKTFNDQPVPGLAVCRRDVLRLEREHLKPLPKGKFDPVFSKKVKVGINGHVEVNGMYYSIPWQERFQPLTAKYSRHWVKIFTEDSRMITSHHRLHGYPGQYNTSSEHMLPPEEAGPKEWTVERFQRWAASAGPATLKVVNYYLQRGQVPQQGFKIVISLLSLSKTYSYRQLEKACRIELDTNMHHPSFRNILSSFKGFSDRAYKEELFEDQPPQII